MSEKPNSNLPYAPYNPRLHPEDGVGTSDQDIKVHRSPQNAGNILKSPKLDPTKRTHLRWKIGKN